MEITVKLFDKKSYLGVGFKPHGFFERNPAIDVAVEGSKCDKNHVCAKL